MKIALVTAIAAFGLDDDLAPLVKALHKAGIESQILAWDDPTVSWSRFDIVLLRSPWDYTERASEFLAWATRIDSQTQLLNPLAVIRQNTDKHYLADLAKAGIAVVPSVFIEPKSSATLELATFLKQYPVTKEFVVKPAIGAGSRDAQRYGREQSEAALRHITRLLEEKRSVLLQPYLSSVDEQGETALIFFGGHFSHAIRKGALLQRDEGPTNHLFAPEQITARTPNADEIALAQAALATQSSKALAYARVDLIRDDDGSPRLLELELTEPSLFFAFAEKSADRFVATLLKYQA